MPTPDPPTHDDSEERFLVACLKDCACCRGCNTQRPCPGVTSGGMCDRMCFCVDDDDRGDEDDE